MNGLFEMNIVKMLPGYKFKIAPENVWQYNYGYTMDLFF